MFLNVQTGFSYRSKGKKGVRAAYMMDDLFSRSFLACRVCFKSVEDDVPFLNIYIHVFVTCLEAHQKIMYSFYSFCMCTNGRVVMV